MNNEEQATLLVIIKRGLFIVGECFIAGHICEIMYTILTKVSINQITGFHCCASIWGQFANLPQSTCPNWSNIKYRHQCASVTCYKRGFVQLVCVHLCCWRERHFEYSMLPPGLICCSDKITAVLRKNKYYFCGFRVSKNSTGV